MILKLAILVRTVIYSVCPFYEMLLRSKKVSHGDFGKGPEDDNFILNDE